MKPPFSMTRRRLLGLSGLSLGIGALVTWIGRTLGSKDRSAVKPIK